ncbi:MAG: HD domain-containing protein [Actinomycetota bacterium]
MAPADLASLFDEAGAGGWVELPVLARQAIEHVDSPPRLAAHLVLVHDVAFRIAEWAEQRWPDLKVEWDAVRFGAAVHDIGKATESAELLGPGSRHEPAGQRLLEEFGIDPSMARFAVTHGAAVSDATLGLEDLFVILADKVWKGVRMPELEERISSEVSDRLQLDRWDVQVDVLDFLDALAETADERLSWQTSFPVE